MSEKPKKQRARRQHTREFAEGEAADRLAVIGAGAWGTTLASLQSENFKKVDLYDPAPEICEEIARYHTNEQRIGTFRLPGNVFPTTSMERALEGARLVLVAVPSGAFREAARDIVRLLRDESEVIIATKGLEASTGMLSMEIWRQELGRTCRRHSEPMVLTGPNLAVELIKGNPSVSVLAGSDRGSVERAIRAIRTPRFSLFEWHEPLGAQAAGALKNVYALACGISSGLGWGDNVTAAIIWRGLSEAALFIDALGGDPGVITTPAGVGDFIATCTSPSSRNHNLGLRLAGLDGGDSVRGVTEGIQTGREAARRSRSEGLRLQLLESVCAVVEGDRRADDLLRAVLCPMESKSNRAVGRAGQNLRPGWTGEAVLGITGSGAAT